MTLVIAERPGGVRGETFSSSPHAPEGPAVIQPTEETVLALARSYIADRVREKLYDRKVPYLQGEREIQGQLLGILGQEHLLYANTMEIMVAAGIRPLKEVKPGDIENLVGSYRLAKGYCLDARIRRVTNKDRAETPLDERMRGRMDKLAEVLRDLGQKAIVESIDSELGMRPELVNFKAERTQVFSPKGETY